MSNSLNCIVCSNVIASGLCCDGECRRSFEGWSFGMHQCVASGYSKKKDESDNVKISKVRYCAVCPKVIESGCCCDGECRRTFDSWSYGMLNLCASVNAKKNDENK
jgi:hypothetical protein